MTSFGTDFIPCFLSFVAQQEKFSTQKTRTLAHQLTALSALCCNPGGGHCSLQLVITILHTLSLILAGFVDL